MIIAGALGRTLFKNGTHAINQDAGAVAVVTIIIAIGIGIVIFVVHRRSS